MPSPRPYLTQRSQSRQGTKPFVPFVPLCEKKTPTAAFTVIELLLVIGVLSVMLAIIMPGTKALRDASNRRRAAAEATALAQAAIRYKTEYGFWPGELQPNNDGTCKLNSKVADKNNFLHLIISGPSTFTDDIEFTGNITPNVLRLRTTDSPSNEIYRAFSTVGDAASGQSHPGNPLNPRAIRFLDLQDEGVFDRVGYPDPWGQPYRLVMGLNPHSTFTFKVKNQAGAELYSFPISNTTCFAFSPGPPNLTSTNNIYSAGVQP
jgi:type II secretory pathway pseudopilin PulG